MVARPAPIFSPSLSFSSFSVVTSRSAISPSTVVPHRHAWRAATLTRSVPCFSPVFRCGTYTCSAPPGRRAPLSPLFSFSRRARPLPMRLCFSFLVLRSGRRSPLRWRGVGQCVCVLGTAWCAVPARRTPSPSVAPSGVTASAPGHTNCAAASTQATAHAHRPSLMCCACVCVRGSEERHSLTTVALCRCPAPRRARSGTLKHHVCLCKAQPKISGFVFFH